jgi:superfamily II DNA or RNA helicase
LLREIRHNHWDFEPFDLVIFDEAHYMRNPATTHFHLGEALSAGAGAVLCVSATPVATSNTDLHSLLKLVDENLFESQTLFDELLEANRPTVRAITALARVPVDTSLLKTAIADMAKSKFIQDTPLYARLVELTKNLNTANTALVAKCQDTAECLNLLGSYVNRTRRIQVDELRAIRDVWVRPVEYTPREMELYSTILHMVRSRCRQDSSPFHVFQVIGLQLRAASCLPVLAYEVKEGRFGDPLELISEAYSDEIQDELYGNQFKEDLNFSNFGRLLDYDFETNDSKYKQLRHLLLDLIPTEKVVIFAYYRPTLAYLKRRLLDDNITVIEIHGGVPADERWKRIEHFSDPGGPRILLSSEVGSEGIDLQFCRVVVNYDLPWNPMRVEQRIGRIDRVGQQAKRLVIVNFKVRGTIEERLYDRLHLRLETFRNSIGDLEEVIGKEVQQLTIDLLSKELTPEQEQARIERAGAVIEGQLLALKQLEEKGDTLLAFSDYLQRQIDEARGKGRFIQPEELEDYIKDFFNREYRGCALSYNTPQAGCLRVQLTLDAQNDLRNTIGTDTSPTARPFHQREFTITFRRDVMQQLSKQERRQVHFANHMSPLIKWITKVNQARAHGLYNVSALILESKQITSGAYCYLIERWKITGLQKHECLAYSIVSLEGYNLIPEVKSESIIQKLLHEGKDWYDAEYSLDVLEKAYRQMEDTLRQQFDVAVTDFDAQNATTLQIREQRVRGYFDRRIVQDEQRLNTMQQQHPESNMIKLMEGRLRTAKENRQQKIETLRAKERVDMVRAPVAAGIFMVV